MASYRELAKRHPSFRERSETEALIAEISLQPWRAFGMDGVIFFSDILTPLPAMGMDFTIDEARGPVVADVVRVREDVPRLLGEIQLDRVGFALDALRDIRGELAGEGVASAEEKFPSPSPALIGFVGSPFTLATYAIEGSTSATLSRTKRMAVEDPETLRATLEALTAGLARYAAAQVEAGAQYLVVFDSWGGKLTPSQWDEWSGPFLRKLMNDTRAILEEKGYDARWRDVKGRHGSEEEAAGAVAEAEVAAGAAPATTASIPEHPASSPPPRLVLPPIAVYALGTGGLLERLAGTGADVVGVDMATDLDDARRRVDAVRPGVVLQGNVDPAALLAGERAIQVAAREALSKGFFVGAEPSSGEGVAGRILNVGHGLIPSTPEDAVRQLVGICKGQREENR